jgi:hypothetical protein
MRMASINFLRATVIPQSTGSARQTGNVEIDPECSARIAARPLNRPCERGSLQRGGGGPGEGQVAAGRTHRIFFYRIGVGIGIGIELGVPQIFG